MSNNDFIKKQLKIALYAIENITELEVSSEQKNALKMCFPLFESSFNLLDCLERIICVTNKECKISTIWKVLEYAKSKFSKII